MISTFPSHCLQCYREIDQRPWWDGKNVMMNILGKHNAPLLLQVSERLIVYFLCTASRFWYLHQNPYNFFSLSSHFLCRHQRVPEFWKVLSTLQQHKRLVHVHLCQEFYENPSDVQGRRYNLGRGSTFDYAVCVWFHRYKGHQLPVASFYQNKEITTVFLSNHGRTKDEANIGKGWWQQRFWLCETRDQMRLVPSKPLCHY